MDIQTVLKAFMSHKFYYDITFTGDGCTSACFMYR